MASGGSLLPPIVSPSSLYSQEAKRDATRIRIYNSVLTHIYNKIRAVARVPGNEKSLWFLVPEFIPGTPRFDIGDCIIYLTWNLRNVGYQVEYTHPNLMFISWRNHDAKYRAQESPWAQVLSAAREQVLTTATTNTAILAAPSRSAASVRPRSAMTPTLSFGSTTVSQAPVIESEVKRKSVLKKTTEFQASIPGLSIAAEPAAQLTGTLTPRHVSFV